MKEREEMRERERCTERESWGVEMTREGVRAGDEGTDGGASGKRRERETKKADTEGERERETLKESTEVWRERETLKESTEVWRERERH